MLLSLSLTDAGRGDAEASVRQLQQVHQRDGDHQGDEAGRARNGPGHGGREVSGLSYFVLSSLLSCYEYVYLKIFH